MKKICLFLLLLFSFFTVVLASDLTGQIDGHNYVDLGLSSGKYWSTVNYGANLPEEGGEYVDFPMSDIVSYYWGSNWRIPTKDEFQELIDECEWTWTSKNGVNGYIIKGKNGNTVFFPAAGLRTDILGISNKGTLYYWTMTKADRMGGPSYMYMLFANESEIKLITEWNVGIENYPIRPISNIEEKTKVKEYAISISSSGNGSVIYNSSTVRNKTSNFDVKEGTDVTISFSPDNGYQIKSVKMNSLDVTSKVSNNQYTISNINANTNVEVVFEAIPPTTYFLTIKASSNGSVTYDNTVIRGQSKSFTVNEGANATVLFSPDNGYRIKKVQVNGRDVTLNGSDNQYTISNIQGNTTLDVYFEAIPPKTYTLTITVSDNGSATFDGNTVRDKSTSFSVNEGTNATITFTPDNGYRIKSIKVNNSDVINNVSNNRYTINNISSNTTLNVEFEAIPPTIYTLTISATGSGHVSCNDISVENGTQSISIESGLSVIIKFYPNDGHQIKIAKVNNANVTSSISNNQYTIKIDSNTTVEVEFEEIVNSMIVDGVNYVVNDQQDNTIQVVAGDYGLVLEVPVSVVYNNRNWTVVGIEQDALTSCQELAAVIWEPKAQFNAMLKNPNFLLYVSDEKYASRSVKNVVVNGVAESIELTDDANGNDFYCPRVFKAKSIIYKHNYQMETGIGDSRGWETIVLPFDVQKYTHATKGELESFTTWSKGSSKKPFWLFELTTSGYKDVAGIKANTPYIISMPNNIQYEQQYQIPGVVTFSASDVEVQKSDNMKPGSYQGRSLVPNYTNKSDENYLVLNVSNNYVTNPGKDISGSKFVRGLRAVHPFEAYMTTTDNTRSIDVIEGMTTAIRGIQMVKEGASVIKVYDTRGVLMKTATSIDDVRNGLKSGVYIVNGKKMVIK